MNVESLINARIVITVGFNPTAMRMTFKNNTFRTFIYLFLLKAILFSSLSCILVTTKKNDYFYINNFTYTKNSENRKGLLDYETEVCGINYTNRELLEKLRLALNTD